METDYIIIAGNIVFAVALALSYLSRTTHTLAKGSVEDKKAQTEDHRDQTRLMLSMTHVLQAHVDSTKAHTEALEAIRDETRIISRANTGILERTLALLTAQAPVVLALPDTVGEAVRRETTVLLEAGKSQKEEVLGKLTELGGDLTVVRRVLQTAEGHLDTLKKQLQGGSIPAVAVVSEGGETKTDPNAKGEKTHENPSERPDDAVPVGAS